MFVVAYRKPSSIFFFFCFSSGLYTAKRCHPPVCLIISVFHSQNYLSLAVFFFFFLCFFFCSHVLFAVSIKYRIQKVNGCSLEIILVCLFVSFQHHNIINHESNRFTKELYVFLLNYIMIN